VANCQEGDDPVNSFIELLIAIANNTIPKSKLGKHTVNTIF